MNALLKSVAIGSALLLGALPSSSAWAQAGTAAPRAPLPPMPPAAPPPLTGMHLRGGLPGEFFGPPGIPAKVAQRIGLSADTVKKVRDLSFDANEQLIPLEADLKKAQLDLERTLTTPAPDEATVLAKLEVVSKAEWQVRKNRVSLLLKIRKLVGPDAWEKLQAEMGMGDDEVVNVSGDGSRREVRIIRRTNGMGGETETIEGAR